METPAPISRKRPADDDTPARVIHTGYSSIKRRRTMSYLGELPARLDEFSLGTSEQSYKGTADRFISIPLLSQLPLQWSLLPSTSSKRVLSFGDALASSLPTTPFLSERRDHAASLHRAAPQTPASSPSAAYHLSPNPLTVLDAFQPASAAHACPLAWSPQGTIGIVCRNKTYLSNRATTTVFSLDDTTNTSGSPESLEFASATGDTLAVALSATGTVQYWDVQTRAMLRAWPSITPCTVGAFAYNPSLNLLAVGRAGGWLTLYDPRTADPALSSPAPLSIGGRKSLPTALRWSADGRFLACGDARGALQIWDVRAGAVDAPACAMKRRAGHRGAVKALAWCPWQADLLASGGLQPDGTINLWSTKRLGQQEPLGTVQLSTAVTSLHWSPHCKELLSTHGASWDAAPAARRPSQSLSTSGRDDARGDRPAPVLTRFTNSVHVHRLKGTQLERVAGVPRAHLAPVSASALSPDGTQAYTLCVREGIMKLWSVWGEPEKPRQRHSVLDVERCIR